MKRHTKNLKKINSKILLVVFFITMFLLGTSYAILTQELTLTGTVNMKIEDEGTDLTITNFNTGIDPIYTQYLFNIIPVSGYKVVGITIQNTLSRTINNWTVEFTSSRNAETTKPTNNQLSAYLGAEFAYGSVTNSNGTVIVTGNDTLAPGDTKTVYVFFSCNLLNNNITFGNERAYYTPNRGRLNNSKSNIRLTSLNDVKNNDYKRFDIYETDEFAILICYDTTIVADNLYNTIMYIFIGDNTGSDISNIKFDVKYRNSNLSNLLASSISIVENNDSGASFICNDVINNKTCKGYIVTGLKTYGGFDGMEITNISYSVSNGNTVNEEQDITINNDNNLGHDDKEIIDNNTSEKSDEITIETSSNTFNNDILNVLNIENIDANNNTVIKNEANQDTTNINEENIEENDINENNNKENDSNKLDEKENNIIDKN